VNKLKQLMNFLFKSSEALMLRRHEMLRTLHPNLDSFLAYAVPILISGLDYTR
jgi:hypothetical protein